MEAQAASTQDPGTAPSSGTATFDTCTNTTFDSTMAVYTGSAVNALTRVNDNNDACGNQSSVSFSATGGTTYQIQVDGLNGAVGSFELTGVLLPAPANDAFSSAEAISGATGSVAGTNVDATTEAGEPATCSLTCGVFDDGPYHTVWYAWTAPNSGTATFDTCTNTTLDTMLAVYTGSAVNALTRVNDNNDACGIQGYQSSVTFSATGGTTYLIQVDGYTGVAGSFELTWSPPVPVLTGFSPVAVAQKKVVTILGSGLSGATVVSFAKAGCGTVVATTFSVTDDGHISATVPVLAATGVVSVTTPGGTGSSTINLKIKPTLKSFTPVSGPRGTVVTLTGSAFTGATKVTLNGVNAPVFTVLSDTKISVTVSAGATTGAFQVKTPGGKVTSKTAFTVT